MIVVKIINQIIVGWYYIELKAKAHANFNPL